MSFPNVAEWAGAPNPPAHVPTLFLDVTDLIHWVKNNSSVTGIQRVHLNYALHAVGSGIKFVMFHGRACERVGLVDEAVIEYIAAMLSGRIKPSSRTLFSLCPNARLEPWQDYSEKHRGNTAKYLWHTFGGNLRFRLTQLLFSRTMASPDFKAGDALLNVGRSWTIGGYVKAIDKLKQRHHLSAQILLHDIIPITHPHESGTNRLFKQFIRESFTTFDRFFTSSEYNRTEIRKCMVEFSGTEKPIEKSFFGQNINSEGMAETDLPAGLQRGHYLLCVGRVAESKNQARLLKAWLRVLESGHEDGLTLVIVGRRDRKYRELNEVLKSSPLLQDKVLFMDDISDEQLNTLYKHCYFTVFPSLIEGYGLPAAESISYGKFCLASHAASIPEAAGEHAGYFDPLDIDDIHAKLLQYIQDKELLREREALIRAMPRMSWAEASADLFSKARRAL